VKKLCRVFALVPDCHAPSGHYRSLWQRHFYDGLRGAVDQVIIPHADFAWARPIRPLVQPAAITARTETSAQLWDQIKRAAAEDGIDAVVSYCFAEDIELALVKDTIQLGVPWINFFCDSTHRFEEIAALAKVVSMNWFPEKTAATAYRALGVPAFNQAYAFNPVYLEESVCRSPGQPVIFIGFPSSNRITQLGWLRLLGVPVTIRGHGWRTPASPFHNPNPERGRIWRALRQADFGEKIARRLLWPLVKRYAGEPVDDAGLATLLRQYQVVLGLNQGRDPQGRLVSYMKFRDLEFPGYGCCYLTESNPDLAETLVVGREVLTYSSLIEARQQVAWCRRHPDLARAVGEAGRRRVLSDHTWKVRIQQLAAAL
jgi:spore maturation protein CgeB